MIGDDEHLRQLFRQAFRRHAATVTVISYLDADGRPCGMTATAVCSLSVTPPALLVCVNRSTKTRERIAASGRFGVNLLASSQREIAAYCSQAGTTKVLHDDWVLQGADGCATPVLKAALAHCDCEVVREYEEATHSIVVGRVRHVRLGAGDRPLVYFDGAYSTLDRQAG